MHSALNEVPRGLQPSPEYLAMVRELIMLEGYRVHGSLAVNGFVQDENGGRLEIGFVTERRAHMLIDVPLEQPGRGEE